MQTSVDRIPLWSEHPSERAQRPYGQETLVPEVQGKKNVRLIRNVTEPSLTVYRPDPARASGAAVIVCPGGSFVSLTVSSGADIAAGLAEQGITAFVLNYRLLPTPPNDADFLRSWADYDMASIKLHALLAVADALDAIRLVRTRAATQDLDPARIGILGFSGGGVLTIAAATGYSAASRPDFAAAIYGATWHDYVVPVNAPPLFLAFAGDDPGEGVLAGNLGLYDAWQTAGCSVEMHAYAEGGHGFAMEHRGLPCDTWIDRYLEWLRALG